MENVMKVLRDAHISFDARYIRMGMILVDDFDDEININKLLREAGIEDYRARPVNALHPFLDPRLIIEEKDL